MYLSAKTIQSRITELNIATLNGEHEFNIEEQLQPASIDLKLSNVFWVPSSKRPLDLQKATIMEISPRRFWRKKVLAEGEHVLLRPKQMILGRVHEVFTMPNDCAGKIEGRSSYARLGISVHCTGDFINPGYRGSMPLQLVNHNPFSIRVYPYVPLCQLMLIKLDDDEGMKYGHADIKSKYIDDDGGPSYWWRDRQIKRLRENMRTRDISEKTQQDVLKIIGQDIEPEIIEQLADFADRTHSRHKADAEVFLIKFSQQQERIQYAAAFGKIFLLTVAGGMVGEGFSMLHGKPEEWETHLWLASTLLALIIACIWVSLTTPPCFGRKECRKVLDAHRNSSA